jgi:oligogalacturonide lyase
MAKFDSIRLDFQDTRDPSTGARVTRLTPPDVLCHRNYFYQKCFTHDARRLLFAGAFGPYWNYYLLDLECQTARQLTDQAGENTFGGFLSGDDRHLYLVRGDRDLIRVDLETAAEEVVYRVPQGWDGYGTWVANSACTKLVGIEIRSEDNLPLTDWGKFRVMFESRPRCRLVRIDLGDGRCDVLLEQERWLGHPQYRPQDDRTVAYCHEGPHDLVEARMWFIDEDGANNRCGRRQEPGEACTHEFFVPDGSSMVYVLYAKGHAERWICSLDPMTLEDRRLMAMPPCSHLMSNGDGSLIVGDGIGMADDVADPQDVVVEGNPFLCLFDMGRRTWRHVARHGSSWRTYKGSRQVTHPHPSFSPDGRSVLFTSDRDGEPAVYLAEIPR